MLLFSFTGTGMFAHPLLMCFKVAWLELSCFRTACVHITTDFLVWYSFYLGVDLRMRPVLIPTRLRRPNSHHRSDLSSLTFIHVLWVLISSFYKNKATVRFLYLTLSFKSLIAKFVASAKGEPLEEHDYLGYTAASWQRQHWEAEEAWASTAGGLSQSSPHSLPSCVQPQPWNRPRMTCIAWEAFCWEVWGLSYASLRSRFFTWSSGAPFSSWFLTVCFGHTFAPAFSVVFVLSREIHCTQVSALPILLFWGKALFLWPLPAETQPLSLGHHASLPVTFLSWLLEIELDLGAWPKDGWFRVDYCHVRLNIKTLPTGQWITQPFRDPLF